MFITTRLPAPPVTARVPIPSNTSVPLPVRVSTRPLRSSVPCEKLHTEVPHELKVTFVAGALARIRLPPVLSIAGHSKVSVPLVELMVCVLEPPKSSPLSVRVVGPALVQPVAHYLEADPCPLLRVAPGWICTAP